jgi:excisionase family DNA binding protein
MTTANQLYPTGKAYLTIREAARYANCSPKTIRRAIKAGALPHHRFGSGKASETCGKIHINTADLQTFIDGCRINAIG